jgi:hypothetical protein
METRTPDTKSRVVPHQVLSALSHELRGPLGVARGSLRLLESQLSGNPGSRRTVELAARATDQMATLIEEVSRYTRLARGEAPLHPRPTPLAAVLQSASQQLASQAGAGRPIEVEVSEGAMAFVDPDATAEGCAALATALGRAHAEAGKLRFRDVPTGGDPSVAVLIAAEFSPEATAHTRPARLDRSGAGLSLALAELVLRLQGGRLEEHWVREKWVGYVLHLPTAQIP